MVDQHCRKAEQCLGEGAVEESIKSYELFGEKNDLV